MFRSTVLFLLYLFASGAAFAATMEPGAALPELVLEDQHDQRFVLTPDTRCLLFAADKAGSDIVGQALEGMPKARLEALGLRYVADISAMPSLITKMFALPALRARPYAVGLVRDAAITADFPRQTGAVTVLRFAGGKLTAIEFAHDAAALQKALGAGK